ncbi:MAG: hypothetical protein ABJA62_08065 [Luteimonas sp.]
MQLTPDGLGWAASAILIATLLKQVWTQLHEKDARGVSLWLFAGQIAASVGFIAYSWLLSNWVFIVTNTLILCTALLGQAVVVVKKHRSGGTTR